MTVSYTEVPFRITIEYDFDNVSKPKIEIIEPEPELLLPEIIIIKEAEGSEIIKEPLVIPMIILTEPDPVEF